MSINNTFARPYAKAAFELAIQQKTVPAWTKLLQTAAWVVSQPKIQRFLQDPRYSWEMQCSQLVAICEPVLNDEGRSFFNLLAKSERLFVLPEIAELFMAYKVEHEKTVHVEVTSALPLTDTEQQHLSQALKIRLQRDVTLDCGIDSSIIGGAIIRAGDLVIDSSIRSLLARLKTTLIN